MSRQTTVGLVLLTLFGIGLAYLAWSLTHSTTMQTCGACGRPVHAAARTEGRVDGSLELFCCPTCALTERRQTGEDVQVTRLTDHASGQPLDPQHALAVYESDFNMCLRESVLRTDRSEAASLDFDRCAPSIVAFADQTEAQAFAAQHGGRVVPFAQLVSQYAATGR